MQPKSGFSTTGIVTSVIAIAIIFIIGIIVVNRIFNNYGNYDPFSIIQPSEHNGQIGDHIKGPADAPVIIYEYADYQCPGCASMNSRVNTAIAEADGRLAVVYRNFLLPYHNNGTAAASAAEAAGLQGYWKPYADLLFANQAEWENASPSERTALFEQYFNQVTNNQGDTEKFLSDLSSANVSKKIKFDRTIAERIRVPGTPAFYVDGQLIDFGNKNGGKLTINGETIEWDHILSGEEFVKLVSDIVAAKTKK